MKKSKLILSILFLGIYASIVLHNSIPHFHNSPVTLGTSAQETHHNHHQDHQHDHSHDTPNLIDYLLNLLGDVSHTDLGEGHFENFTSQTDNYQYDFSSGEIIQKDFVATHELNYSLCLCQRIALVDHPQILYEQLATHHLPQRAPPPFILS